jgi:hypothetical protein
MTTADLKGDTARGAAYLSREQNKWRDKKVKQYYREPPAQERDYDIELRDYLKQPVDVLALIKKLDFSEEDFEGAAMEQPALYLDAARLRVQKMRKRAQAKIASETEKAQARIRIQGTIQEKNDRTTLKKTVRVAERAYEFALSVEEFTKGLMRAFEERDKAIAIIKDARWAESGNVVRRLKEKEGRELARKAQQNVRDRYRNLRTEDDDEA